MAKLDFYTIDKAEKAAIFNALAAELGMTPFAVEKDWWVSRTLNIIFQMDIFDDLINNLRELRTQLQGVTWPFGLTFSVPNS
jgi:hypothetical protein